MKLHLQLVATDHTTGRVQDVGMANVAFGVKRALHRQGAALGTGSKHCFGATALKPQLQFGLPALTEGGFSHAA